MSIETKQAPMSLASVELLEQRTYGDTVYTTVQRCYNDGNGACVLKAVDPPQAQLDANQWPELKAARDAYLVLVEKAAAYMLDHTADPGQAYVPAMVGNLSAEVKGTTATLSWKPVKGATGYRTYRGEGEATRWTQAVSHGYSDLNRPFSGLSKGKTYTLGVASVGTGGESLINWVTVSV